MLVRIVNREDTDQTASPDLVLLSDLGLHCLSRPFYKTIIVRNFRTSTYHTLLYTYN